MKITCLKCAYSVMLEVDFDKLYCSSMGEVFVVSSSENLSFLKFK